MSVLVTGFGPFADQPVNPSGQLATQLDGGRIAGEQVFGLLLPVATDRVAAELDRALDRLDPRVVLVLGLAPGRPAPALERLAVNVRDFPVPDVDGVCSVDQPVVPGAPAAYLATLPIKAVLAAWRQAGVPGYVSNTAGTYVCNQTYYLARHRTGATCRVGLVHLPPTPESAAANAACLPATTTLPLPVALQAVTLALQVALRHTGPDLPLAAGALS